MRLPLPLLASVAVAAVPCVVGAGGQSRVRSSVDLVQVWASVTDANGRHVTGLTREDFEVAEDGVPQPLTHFSGERVPVSLGVVVDSSDSMRGEAMIDARAAVDRFLGDLLQPVDQAFVSTFSHEPRMLADWTRPTSALRGALDPVRPGGGTAIYDALKAFAPILVRRVHPRAALLVISDGADTASDASLNEAREALRRTDALVYAIAIDAPDARASTRVNPAALQQITAPSGGYTEVVRAASDLAPATERIAEELNHQYSLAYALPRRADDSWRSIRVRMKNPAYSVRARRGYFASLGNR
jgi:Ca-activated chloride channel family protein